MYLCAGRAEPPDGGIDAPGTPACWAPTSISRLHSTRLDYNSRYLYRAHISLTRFEWLGKAFFFFFPLFMVRIRKMRPSTEMELAHYWIYSQTTVMVWTSIPFLAIHTLVIWRFCRFFHYTIGTRKHGDFVDRMKIDFTFSFEVSIYVPLYPIKWYYDMCVYVVLRISVAKRLKYTFTIFVAWTRHTIPLPSKLFRYQC